MPDKNDFNRYHIFLIQYLLRTAYYMDRYYHNGMQDDLIRIFSLSESTMSSLSFYMFIPYLTFAVFAGYISDKVERWYVIAGGLILDVVALTICTFSFTTQSWATFVFGRALTILAQTFMGVCLTTYIADLFTGDKRTEMLSIYYTANALGTAMANILPGILAMMPSPLPAKYIKGALRQLGVNDVHRTNESSITNLSFNSTESASYLGNTTHLGVNDDILSHHDVVNLGNITDLSFNSTESAPIQVVEDCQEKTNMGCTEMFAVMTVIALLNTIHFIACNPKIPRGWADDIEKKNNSSLVRLESRLDMAYQDNQKFIESLKEDFNYFLSKKAWLWCAIASSFATAFSEVLVNFGQKWIRMIYVTAKIAPYKPCSIDIYLYNKTWDKSSTGCQQNNGLNGSVLGAPHNDTKVYGYYNGPTYKGPFMLKCMIPEIMTNMGIFPGIFGMLGVLAGGFLSNRITHWYNKKYKLNSQYNLGPGLVSISCLLCAVFTIFFIGMIDWPTLGVNSISLLWAILCLVFFVACLRAALEVDFTVRLINPEKRGMAIGVSFWFAKIFTSLSPLISGQFLDLFKKQEGDKTFTEYPLKPEDNQYNCVPEKYTDCFKEYGLNKYTNMTNTEAHQLIKYSSLTKIFLVALFYQFIGMIGFFVGQYYWSSDLEAEVEYRKQVKAKNGSNPAQQKRASSRKKLFSGEMNKNQMVTIQEEGEDETDGIDRLSLPVDDIDGNLSTGSDIFVDLLDVDVSKNSGRPSLRKYMSSVGEIIME